MLLLVLSILSRLIDPTHFDEAYLRHCLMMRIADKRPAVEDSTCLAASRHHSRYMAVTQSLGHVETGAAATIEERKVDGEICLTYLAYTSYFQLSYEQLADKMIDAWLASPDHKAILLNPKLGKVGIGVVYNRKDDTYYAVVNFKYN